MKNNAKKWMTVAGCLAVCIVLIAVITGSFGKETVTDDPLSDNSSQQDDVVVNPDSSIMNPVELEDDNKEQKSDVTVNPEAPNAGNSASSGNGADSTGTEQTIQGTPVKPAYTEKELKDPTKTPDGTPVEGAPKPQDHDTYKPPKDVPKNSGEPQGGDVNESGQTYLPGFGWIEDSGENHGEYLEDMYENGNKVGIMN